MPELIVEPATRVPWNAVESVLGSVGAAAHCWCRSWLTTNADYSALDDDARRTATETEHASGTIRGLITSRAGQPVGWVGVGPRADYARLPRTAIEHARSAGAQVIEAYPVDTAVCRAPGLGSVHAPLIP